MSKWMEMYAYGALCTLYWQAVCGFYPLILKVDEEYIDNAALQISPNQYKCGANCT